MAPVFTRKTLLLGIFLVACGVAVLGDEEYQSFHEEDFDYDEEENLDEEVEYPGGVTAELKPRRMSDVPRPPFTVKTFDQGSMEWRTPFTKEGHAKEVHRQVHNAWELTVFMDLEEASKPGTHDLKRIAAGNMLK